MMKYVASYTSKELIDILGKREIDAGRWPGGQYIVNLEVQKKHGDLVVFLFADRKGETK